MNTLINNPTAIKFVNPEDSVIPRYLEDHFNINDTVIVIDGSYMMDEKGNHVAGIYFKKSNIEYELLTVIGTNKSYPTAVKPNDVLAYQNNCKLKGSDGKIYFCSRINIKRWSLTN